MTRTFNIKGLLAAVAMICCLQSAFAQAFWTEDFSNQTTATANWVSGGTNAGSQTWTWTNDPLAGYVDPNVPAFNAATAGTGYFIFNSDANGDGNAHDVTLTGTGNPADCSGKNDVKLRFHSQYIYFNAAASAQLGVSTDGTNFTYYELFDGLGANQIFQGPVEVDLNEADGKPQVWLQFRWVGNYEYHWKIDDVQLSATDGPVPCDQNPMAIICDNFDTYNTAQKLGPQATHWTTWSGTEGTTEDGIVSTEQANTAPNSLKIISTATSGGPQDVILNLSNKSTGSYELKFKVYVPTGKNGYYNMQQVIPLVGGNGNWNFNVFFNNAGAGQFTDGANAELATFTYPHDQWFECRHTFDLDNNLQGFYVNGVFVKKAAYTGNLGGIDFFGTNNVSTFYVDDVEYVEKPAVVFAPDNCDGAVDLSLYFGQAPNVPQTTGIYDNTNATVGSDDPVAPGCFLDGVSQTTPGVAKIDNSMWFTFTGDGDTYHIETVPCNSTNYIDDGDTQMAIYTGECGNLLPVSGACNEDLTGADDFRSALDFETENGVDYHMLIDGWSINNVVASGEYCIEITRLPNVTCADGAVGTFEVANNGFVCNGATTASVMTLNDASFTLPTIGPVYGMTWAITTEPVTGGAWPPSLTSYWGSFAVNPSLYLPNLTNSGNPLTQNAIWYFTPVVVAGAVDTIPANAAFLHQLDITDACYFVGESQPLILLGELNPLEAVADVTPATPGNSDGVIDLTVTGGIFDILQDPALSYTVEWTGPNGFSSNDEDISGLEPGDYTAVITDLTGCADPYDYVVSVTTGINDPDAVKSLSLTPNPTTNMTRLNMSLDKTADVRIEVLNTVGQTLQTIDAGKVNALNQQIDLTRFANGTYFLRVNIDGETAIRRVVLNR